MTEIMLTPWKVYTHNGQHDHFLKTCTVQFDHYFKHNNTEISFTCIVCELWSCSHNTQYMYRIRPYRRTGRLREFVLYHLCQKIVKWAIISENKVKSQDKDRLVGDNKWK